MYKNKRDNATSYKKNLSFTPHSLSILLSNNLSEISKKKSFKKFISMRPKENDFSVLLDRFSNKTQVNSPRLMSLISSPKSIEHRSNSFIFENFSNHPNDFEISLSGQNSNFDKPNQLRDHLKNTLSKMKLMYNHLKELYSDLVALQDDSSSSLRELLNVITRRNNNLEIDPNLFFTNTKIKQIIQKNFKEALEVTSKKSKKELLKLNESICELKAKLAQKDEEIAKLKGNSEHVLKKLAMLEEQNNYLNNELYSQLLVNSKLARSILVSSHYTERVKLTSVSDIEATKNDESLPKDLSQSALNLSDLQKENLDLKSRIEDLINSHKIELKQFQNNEQKVRDLEKQIEKLLVVISERKEKYLKMQTENMKYQEQEKKRLYLYSNSGILSKIEDFPMDITHFKSLLPKLMNFIKNLESILIFRQSFSKTFTIKDELLVFREVPIDFLEKSLFFFRALTKITEFLISKNDFYSTSDQFIKELEVNILGLKEQICREKIQFFQELKDQEDLFLSEIEQLHQEINFCKQKNQELEQNCNCQLDYEDKGNSPLKISFMIEVTDSPILLTPNKKDDLEGLLAKIEELSSSISKTRNKAKKLKEEKKALLEELQSFQFGEKFSYT